MDLAKIKRALVSVSDKAHLVNFVRSLTNMGVEIVSTGGTARLLEKEDIPVRAIDDFTGFPEIMDGRVKTLHPKVHGGLLNIRDNAEHQAAKTRLGIEDIDMVVVNLYPFEQTVARPDVTFEDAIENIDIGGPTMIRSAAKNHAYVTVVTDTADYAVVIEEMTHNDGATHLETRARLARKVFALTSRYDAAISAFLENTREISRS